MRPPVRARNGWGEYQSHVEDALASCVDYGGRLQRSLRGEIAPDRHYFLSKAHALEEATNHLVRRCEEIERWIEADRTGSADGG